MCQELLKNAKRAKNTAYIQIGGELFLVEGLRFNPSDRELWNILGCKHNKYRMPCLECIQKIIAADENEVYYVGR